VAKVQKKKEAEHLQSDPLWYKDAIIYETHVRAFCDSNEDGIGDFKGLTQKLDYIRDLGVTAIWLLPFCASPLRDDGYDMSDYTDVHASYGTRRDLEEFLREAHSRDLRVITELTLNHSSDQHPWFQRARRAKPGSAWRNYYVWSDTPDKYSDARIIFKDFEPSNWSWDPVAHAYYWHRFYSHQPDLNYDNPAVRKAVLKVLNYWFGIGVDGLRLDAVPYLYEREGTNCENLDETHAFLRELRRYIDRNYQGRMLLAEANQWPEDAAAYFGDGDECHMNFHFPLMPRLFMSIHTEDRFPIIDILNQTPAVPDNCQWGIFLRNHDELTLEMVTDEERDYMYRVYARDQQMRINLGIRRRLAPLLGNHRRRIELMHGLLFSLPGTPVLYYGDEIGMGDNVYLGDRNAVRTPMQWSPDRNAGFSKANPQRLYLPVIIDAEYHYEALNAEAQHNNPHSLLWWTRRLIALRKRFKVFGRGSIEFLHPQNRKILAFLRRHEDQCVLVVANLSRFVQYVELDLAEFKGMMPVEMFGQIEFPPIHEKPYMLTLGPHSFYWFTIEPQRGGDLNVVAPQLEVPAIRVEGAFESVLLEKDGRAPLEKALPGYMKERRWFGGKARRLRSTSISDVVRFPFDASYAYIASVLVGYVDGNPETYILPLTIATGQRAEKVQRELPQAMVARLKGPAGEAVLYEAVYEKGFCRGLLDAIGRRRRFKMSSGELFASSGRTFRQMRGNVKQDLEPSLMKAEQSNTSIVYGERFILKLFRRLADGVNPELEIGRFLTEKTSFENIARVAGSVEYRRVKDEPRTFAILQGFVQNEGDAWQYTLDALDRYFQSALARHTEVEAPIPPRSLLELGTNDIPALANEIIGPYEESARLLGQRTAELHRALGSDSTDPAFAPESFSTLYQRSLYQSLRSSLTQSFQLLRQRLKTLTESAARDARRLVKLEPEGVKRLQAVYQQKIVAKRIRCHGDYHLGQVLHTGNDFVIIDFEGEPLRSVSERRIKVSPLRDVAGMLRSFHYAAYAGLFNQQSRGVVQPGPEALANLEPWARCWYGWVSVLFLQAYLETAADANLLPQSGEDVRILLEAYLLDKAVYELSYELNNRPDWVKIPLQGIRQLLDSQKAGRI